jgi:carbon-monoxide dehydrogenase large subunit
MTKPAAESRGWAGRPMRRVEDPALVTGRGRFTGDLPAALWVRFVRSPVASGKIISLSAPPGAQFVTAADLVGVKPIRPLIHKFNYAKIGQPILADRVVRFVGEPVAAVLARSQAEAEDLADQVELVIEETPAVVDARLAIADGAAAIHPEAPANVVIEARVKTPGFDAAFAAAHARIALDIRSRRQNATPLEPRGAHAAYDAATGRVTLTCSTQMPHLTRTTVADLIGMPESELRVIAPDVGGGFGQKMQTAAYFGRVDRGPAREPDGELPLARPVRAHRRRLRPHRQAAGDLGRSAVQRGGLFLLSDHQRRRAADGAGRVAGGLRFP